MKTILNLCSFLFLTLSPFLSTSQCEGFDFFVNGTSSECDTDVTQICVDIPGGIIPSGDCGNSYIIRVSYSSTAFNYTNLTISNSTDDDGVWNDITDNGSGTTVLEWNIVPISYFSTSACFEGIAIGNLPNFTFELYSTDNPVGVILNSQSSSLGNTIVINGDMTVSDAISLGLLEDESISNSTYQEVYLDGVLTVDQDYFFGSPAVGVQSKLIMSPNSQIVIENGFSLGINSTELITCDEEKWKGIVVNDGASLIATFHSSLSNATTGVELKDGANITLGVFLIDNCVDGIAAYGDQLKQINLQYFGSPGLFGVIKDCKIGMNLENTSLINLVGHIQFSNNDIGILAVKTSMFLTRINIADSHVAGIQASEAITININECFISNIGSDANSATGIILNDVGLSNIKNNTYILGFQNGVILNEITGPQQFYIDHCLLRSNRWSDISANIFPGSVGVIFSNTFGTTKKNAAYHNCIIRGKAPGTLNHEWSINDNDNMIALVSNVQLSAINRGSIFKNDNLTAGALPLEEFGRGRNFIVSGGERNIINNNNDIFAPVNNLLMINSQMSQVSCNDDMFSYTSMKFLNDNAGSEIWRNKMKSLFYNYEYGTPFNTYSVTDIQENHKNLFDPSIFENPKARHYGPSILEVNLSQHLIRTFGIQQGHPEYPFFTAISPDWFEGGADAFDPNCPPPGIIENDKIRLLEKSIATGIQIIENEIALSYDASADFESSFKLLRNINALEELKALTDEQELWKNILSSSVVASFVEIEDLFSDLITLKKDVQLELQTGGKDLEELVTQLNDNTPVLIDSNVPSIVDSELNLNLKDEISNLMTQFNDRIRNSEENENVLRVDLSSKLSSLPSVGIAAAENRKNLYSIIIDKMNQGNVSFSKDDLSLLEAISNQCIGTGGEAVLWARALSATNDIVDLYDLSKDECLMSDNDLAEPRIDIRKEIDIFPNPTTGELHINNLPISTDSERSIMLHDHLGRLVFSSTIDENQNEIDLDLSHLPTGLYYLSSSNHEFKTRKINLIK